MDSTLERKALPGLSPAELEQMKRMFSDPLAVPQEFKQWLIAYLESNPPLLPLSAMLTSANSDNLLAYATATASVTVPNPSAEATPKTIVTTTDVVSFDGTTPSVVEFFAPSTTVPAGSNFLTVSVWNATSSIDLGRMGTTKSSTTWYAIYRLTFPAGTYSVSARAWSTGMTGAGTITAGAGGTGVDPPAFLRITKDI